MIELRIVLSDEGKLEITGPIQNKVVCLGILEVAKDVVKHYEAAFLIEHVTVPQNGNFLRKA